MSYKEKVEKIIEYYENKCGLSDWESHFIDDIWRKIESHCNNGTDMFLSHKQKIQIDRIYNKA